jgi:hypothetical protein
MVNSEITNFRTVSVPEGTFGYLEVHRKYADTGENLLAQTSRWLGSWRVSPKYSGFWDTFLVLPRKKKKETISLWLPLPKLWEKRTLF